MNKLFLLSILLVVLVSGCINFGGASVAAFGISETVDNPDIYLKIETSSDNVKSGRTMQVKVTLENRGQDSLDSINVTAYDMCLFEGDNEKHIDKLRSNRTNQWTWKWTAGDTQFERDCNIGFLTEYQTDAYISKTVNVLKESEYYTRELQQTLDEISVNEYSTGGSLKITTEFSEPQPLLEGEDIYLYIKYEDIGNGILNQINAGDIIISVPENLANGTCSGYMFDGTNFVLDQDLKFVNRKAPATSCKFTTAATQLIDSGEITITATYKYQFYNSLLLGVRP